MTITETVPAQETTVPTADQLRARARAKLTKAELQALRVELRREVKAEAKADRAPRVRELPEVASAARRMIRAVGERLAQQGDAEDLTQLVQLQADVTAATQAAVDGLRAQGHSWAYIAGGLGPTYTRQAAQQRFGR